MCIRDRYIDGGYIELKTGKFGPYLQVTNEALEDPVVKRAGLWPNMNPEEIDRDTALSLLAYPIELGVNPMDDKLVTAHYGKNGPYLKSGSSSASISTYEELQSITLEKAIQLLGQKPTNKEIGLDTNTGLPLLQKNGRFGPYISDGKINASIPKDLIGQEISIEVASDLMEKKRNKPAKKK